MTGEYPERNYYSYAPASNPVDNSAGKSHKQRWKLWVGIIGGIILIGAAVFFILSGRAGNLFQASVFNVGTIFGTSADNIATQANLSNPSDTALDPVNHILFISDTDNHRIVVHKLDQNNRLIDRTIDEVIGQINHTDVGARASGLTAAFVTDLGLRSPTGLDFQNGNLYVADTGNNRVLIYDFAQIFPGVTPFSTNPIYIGATYVIGQNHPRDNVNPPGLAANKFNAPEAVSVFDGTENGIAKRILMVADTGNNRVLGFDVRPVTSAPQITCGTATTDGIRASMNASCVLGQQSMTTNTAAAGDLGMSAPQGLFMWGNTLLVSDTGNNRVLIYDARFPASVPRSLCGSVVQPTGLMDGSPALCVFGQSDFSTTTPGAGAFTLNGPTDITIDSFISGFPGSLPVNKRIFIADTGNNRVVSFDATFGGSNGMSAWSVLGQDTFADTVASSGTVGAHFNAPRGVMYDGAAGRQLYVANSGNDRIDAFELVDAGMQTPTTVHMLPPVMYAGTNYRTSLAPFVKNAQGTLSYQILMEHDPSIPHTGPISAATFGSAGTSGLTIDSATGEITGTLRYTSTPSDMRYIFLIRTIDTIPGTDVRFYDTAVYALYVEGPPQSPTCSVYLDGDPSLTTTTIGEGHSGSATIHWASTNAETVVVSPGPGTPSSTVNGTTTVSPTTDTTYTFTFTGYADLSPETGHRDQQPTEVVSCSVTVNYVPPDPEPVLPSCTLTTDPAPASGGTPVVVGAQTKKLVWTSTNATSGSFDPAVTIESGTALNGTSVSLAPNVSTTYTYTVSNDAGTQSCSLVMGVRAPTRCQFTNGDLSIAKGGSGTISWTSTGGASATISPDVTLASGTMLNGSASVSPTSDTTYVLSVIDPAGEIYQCSTNVTVTGCTGDCGGSTTPPSCTLVASKTSNIVPGERVDFTWTSSHANRTVFSSNLTPVLGTNLVSGDAMDGSGWLIPTTTGPYIVTARNTDTNQRMECPVTLSFATTEHEVYDCNVTGVRNDIDEDGNGQTDPEQCPIVSEPQDCNVTGIINNIDEDGDGRTDFEQCPVILNPQDCNVTGIRNDIDEDGNGQTDLEQCPLPENPVSRCPYFTKYVKLGANNDTYEVNLIKHFLTTYEGEDLVTMGGYNGIYTVATDAAVRRFQEKYTDQVLVPWMNPDETWWYKTTRIMGNWLMDCKESPKYLEDDISPLPPGGGYTYDFDYSGNCAVRPGYAAEQNVTRVFGEEIPYCTYVPNYCSRTNITNACQKPISFP